MPIEPKTGAAERVETAGPGSPDSRDGESPDRGDVTLLLSAARRGEPDAVDRLMPLVYDRLRRLARGKLGGRTPGRDLDTTALVHEAYLKMFDRSAVSFQDRNHFLCVAAVAMRQILVDAARRANAEKRGGGAHRVTLGDRDAIEGQRSIEILDLERALTELEAIDQQLCRLVELRFFAGLTVEETAEALERSPRSVKRDWRKARAFLYRALATTSDERARKKT